MKAEEKCRRKRKKKNSHSSFVNSSQRWLKGKKNKYDGLPAWIKKRSRSV